MTIKRSVALMAGATIISRILGFVRIVVVAGLIGTTALGNTFQSTNSISNVLFDLLAAGALSAAIVPQLVHAMAKDKDDFKQLVSSLTSVVIVVLGSVSLVGILFANQIARLMFSRAPIANRDEQIELGTVLLRFFMPQVLLYGLGAVAVAALIANKRFLPQVIAPIGSSIFLMAAIFVFRLVNDSNGLELSTRDLMILGLAGTGACLSFVAIPIIVAIRHGISFVPNTDIRKGARALYSSIWAIAIQAAAAILLGMAILVGNQVDGAVVAYQLAFVFFLAPYAIISQSFSTVLLPDLSMKALEKDETRLKEIVHRMMIWTYVPMLVATALCLALYEPLTEMVARGRASSGQGLIEIAFITLVVGIVPYSVFQALSRVYFAKSNTRFPAITVLVASLVFALSGIIAAKFFDGLAVMVIMGLAHTFTYIVAALVLSIGLHRLGYAIWPNKNAYLVFFLCCIYVAVGIAIEKAIDIETRTSAFIYSLMFVLISALIVFGLLPKNIRKQGLSMAREILGKKEKVGNNG